MKTDNIKNMPQGLREVFEERMDTEGNVIYLDAQYELSNGYIAESIEYLKSIYPNLCLVPIGGQSAGGGVFAVAKKYTEQQIVGLQITPPTAISDKQNCAFTISDQAPTKNIRTQEMHINCGGKIAYVGAGVALDQINATVQDALGTNFAVLGTDLTSSGYASGGATFMTGGMGPTRNNFARSIIEINFCDGQSTKTITDKNELTSLVETYGWTGFVQSIAVPIIEVPPYEFGFALPVNNTPSELAKLVEYFAAKTKMQTEGLASSQAFIAGLEIITGEALQLIYEHSPNMEGLELLMNNCKVANKNAVVFISGAATSNPFEDMEDPLGIFVDNTTSGLALEQATPFTKLHAMKAIREGAPELARRQFKDAPFSYKDHTDINILVNLENCFDSVSKLMVCYETYKSQLEKLINEEEKLEGNVQVYGHINPQGLDPHYRITIVSDNKEAVAGASAKAKEFYALLVTNLNVACKETGSTICGGEKGIISNIKIINALNASGDDIPEALNERLQKQKIAIEKANPLFNWRAKINFAH